MNVALGSPFVLNNVVIFLLKWSVRDNYEVLGNSPIQLSRPGSASRPVSARVRRSLEDCYRRFYGYLVVRPPKATDVMTKTPDGQSKKARW